MNVVTAPLQASGGGGVNPEIVQLNWEAGNPDIAGASSMDNILKKIDQTMSSPGQF